MKTKVGESAVVGEGPFIRRYAPCGLKGGRVAAVYRPGRNRSSSDINIRTACTTGAYAVTVLIVAVSVAVTVIVYPIGATVSIGVFPAAAAAAPTTGAILLNKLV